MSSGVQKSTGVVQLGCAACHVCYEHIENDEGDGLEDFFSEPTYMTMHDSLVNRGSHA